MPQPKLKVELKKFFPDAIVPEYKSMMAGGCDLHAYLPDVHGIQIMPGETRIIPTGIGAFINHPDYALFVWPRSGVSTKSVLKGAGLVDADYTGQIGVVLTNGGTDLFSVKHEDRIAQAVIGPIMRAEFIVVDEFSEVTQRGSGAWGSTGR